MSALKEGELKEASQKKISIPPCPTSRSTEIIPAGLTLSAHITPCRPHDTPASRPVFNNTAKWKAIIVASQGVLKRHRSTAALIHHC